MRRSNKAPLKFGEIKKRDKKRSLKDYFPLLLLLLFIFFPVNARLTEKVYEKNKTKKKSLKIPIVNLHILFASVSSS